MKRGSQRARTVAPMGCEYNADCAGCSSRRRQYGETTLVACTAAAATARDLHPRMAVMSLPQLAICTPVSDLPGQTGRVTVRLMAASPEDLRKSSGQTGWTIWEFPPAILDLKGPGSFDFPGLAVGDNSLYLNFDGFGGFIVCRIPLSEIKAGGTLHFRFTHPEDSPLAELGHVPKIPATRSFGRNTTATASCACSPGTALLSTSLARISPEPVRGQLRVGPPTGT